MTTVATDGKTMAADGMAISHGTIVEHGLSKVIRLDDGTLVGTAGQRSDGDAFKAWLGGGERPKIKKPFEALVLRPDGSCTYHCEHDLEGLTTEFPAAIGSGMDFALAAMDAGASPRRAVEISIRRSPHSGGEVTVLTLGKSSIAPLKAVP